MKIKIYDYANRETEINTKEDIEKIEVIVISGDEIIKIFFLDGTFEKFDSSKSRIINYFDGEYTIETEKIDKWINFNFNSENIKSYQRLEYFEKENEICQD